MCEVQIKAKTTGKNMYCQGYFSSAIVKQVMFAMQKIARPTGRNIHFGGYFSSAIVKQVMFAMRKIARPTGRNILFGGNFSPAIVKQVMCDVCNAKDNQNNRQEHALSRVLKLAIVKLAVCSVLMIDKENMLSRVL